MNAWTAHDQERFDEIQRRIMEDGFREAQTEIDQIVRAHRERVKAEVEAKTGMSMRFDTRRRIFQLQVFKFYFEVYFDV